MNPGTTTPRTRIASVIASVIASMLLASLAHAQTFSNPQPITIRDNNVAIPFPSSITVSGVTQPAGIISITLNNASHSYSSDLEIGLQGPDGTLYPLLSDCGGSASLSGNYTFVVGRFASTFPSAGSTTNVFPGEYAPNVCGSGLQLNGVVGPLGRLIDLVGSANVNGVWSLYIADDALQDTGRIGGGWSIRFDPPTTPVLSTNSILYQGRLTTPDGPVQDEASARFRLFDAASAGNLIGVPVAARITPTDGLFTVPLNFQAPTAFDGSPRWLDIEINGVPVLPRQQLTLAPLAFHARDAARADLADVATSAFNAETAANATNATNATNAVNATNATNAATADFATAAGTVPWSGIASIPINVADLRLAPATLANSSLINGSLGLGAQPLASSRLHALQSSLGATDWHIELTNNTIPAFRGGIRINNAGFFDITNNAGSAVGFFARLNSTGAWTVASDKRLKTDIRPAVGMLDAALKLRPVYFHWLNEDNGPEDFGLIAQDVRDVLPRLVTGDESKDTLTVNYSQLSVVAIAAIQELKAQHDAELAATQAILTARDEAQQDQIDALRAANEDLLKRIERLESRQGK